VFLALGEDAESTPEAYREIFKGHLESGAIRQILDAGKTGIALCGDTLRDKVEAKLYQKVGQGRRGRPNKARAN